MEPYFVIVMAVVASIVAVVFFAPVFLFRPLVLAISKRIAGRQTDTEELKQLKSRLAMLEQQVNDMYSRMGAIEDSNHFAHKVLEDVVKKSGQADGLEGSETGTAKRS